jgi:type 1 fimbriae regulatory protein FimB/type 1 fimbriae regulatory protein FimE
MRIFERKTLHRGRTGVARITSWLNQGIDTRALQHYLGDKNILHTVRYTELSPERFKDFWKD